MAHEHTQDSEQSGNGRDGKNLLIALFLNLGITVAQVIGGLISGSLALIADAAHNGSESPIALVRLRNAAPIPSTPSGTIGRR